MSGQKGTFGEERLPVAASYPRPPRRTRLLAIGGVAALAVVGLAAVELWVGGGRLLSRGPLSSAHAVFGAECANCHGGAERTVGDESCSSCHEKYGDELGVYTFASHYLYRSDDFQRLVPSEHEMPCSSCHVEHEGRHAEITRVPDRRCRSCHPFASLANGHPEFDFAAAPAGERSALEFAHVHHVREVMKRQHVEEIERTCLYCHNAEPDGRRFAPIEFDRHCDACHLTVTTTTPPLPVRRAGDPAPGVEPLEDILARGGPGVRWAVFSNPREYRVRGGMVVKTPVYHRDPWVLENLRSLRRSLYPDAGLADLLVASAEVPAYQLRDLYEEAISTLEAQTVALRGRPEPEIQAELGRIRELLAGLRRAVRDPYAPLDETRFALALEAPRPELDGDEIRAIEAVVADLTEPCRGCHRVEKATIARVQEDQRVLRRAEFDHRAHIVQRRCLDCHDQIPILEHARQESEVEPALDRAAIQNLPRIATCRECHGPRRASDRCVTCHHFHPDKSRRSDLLLYLE